MSKRPAEQLALCVGLSLGLLACSSSSGKPNAVDAAMERAPDMATDRGSADGAETSTTSDARDVGTDLASDRADAHDGGAGGAGGIGSGGTGMGGSGVGGAGTGGSGIGGSGMGGQGGTDAGAGGMSTGTGGATPDAAPDMAAGGTDGSIDSPPDGSPATDSGPACGAGCPANVEPTSLVLWISADVGVTCDQSSPPRVTGWNDRRAGSTVTLAPAPTKLGPRCDGATLNGTPLPYFDRTTTDIDNGVLKVDLTPLNNSDYTVFVVERRRTGNAGFILGTDVPAPLTVPGICVDDNGMSANAHAAYQFGYQSAVVFEAGSYTFNPDPSSPDCNEPSALVSAFSTPQAALEIDFLSKGNTHSLTIGSTTNSSDDVDPMAGLMQGYLGRAFDLPSTSDSRYLGEVAEVVIYKAALSSTEVTAVSNYLKARWGL
jgi:hypothetical protein